MNSSTTKKIAIGLLVIMFFPVILAIILGILVHPLFLLLLLALVFTIPLVKAARG
jgi:hypothetical protein